MSRRRREWDGISNWSSHPCKDPRQANLESFTEVLCVMGWDARVGHAFRRALRSWERAGRPGMPIGADDYRRVHHAERKPN